MQNKKITLMVILCFAAVFSLLYGILTPSAARRRSSSESKAIHKDDKDEPRARLVSSKRGVGRTEYTSWGRSPFLPHQLTVKTVKGLTLSGIIWDTQDPKALISNDIVSIGDQIGANTIVDIRQDRVILNDGTKDFELSLE